MQSYTDTQYRTRESGEAHMSKKTQSLTAQCDSVEADVRQQQDAVRKALRAATEPVSSYPETLALLKQTGREESLPTLGSLVRIIASDCDKYLAEFDELNKHFTALQQTRPEKPGHLSRHYTKMVMLGHSYIDLNNRILSTALAAADDYNDILQSTKENAS